jgi:hypothetical protein
MSEKKLLDAGAETVCGDLILGGKIVGRYRHDQFHITEDGLALVARMDEAADGGVQEVSVARKTARKARASDTPVVTEVPADEGTPEA